MTVCWVIGSGGLLGSALVRVLHRHGGTLFQPTSKFAWADSEQLLGQLDTEVSRFSRHAALAEAWEIHWAAGVGTMGISAADLEQEIAAWKHLLHRLSEDGVLASRPGRIVLASSAGAIYAGLQADVIDEDSSEAPTTPYALAKLEQERLLREFSSRARGVATLAARISTLYGPGQAHGKRQGLIAHMARSIVRNRPIQIFVPFDTVRDYITADDAAAMVVEASRGMAGSGVSMRIVASEQPTTIAEIVATFRRVARRPPLIATSASRLSALYSRRVQFKSCRPLMRETPHTGLHIGVAQVLAAERLAFASP